MNNVSTYLYDKVGIVGNYMLSCISTGDRGGSGGRGGFWGCNPPNTHKN